MRRGWCQVSLRQEILASGCVLQRGGGGVTENAAEIVITIINESDLVVTIIEGDPLCIVAQTSRSRSVF